MNFFAVSGSIGPVCEWVCRWLWGAVECGGPTAKRDRCPLPARVHCRRRANWWSRECRTSWSCTWLTTRRPPRATSSASSSRCSARSAPSAMPPYSGCSGLRGHSRCTECTFECSAGHQDRSRYIECTFKCSALQRDIWITPGVPSVP